MTRNLLIYAKISLKAFYPESDKDEMKQIKIDQSFLLHLFLRIIYVKSSDTL